MSELAKRTNLINSKSDLVDFIKVIAREMEENQTQEANKQTKDYLEAIAGWIDDMDGYYRNIGEEPPQEPTWKMFGEILIASLIYS